MLGLGTGLMIGASQRPTPTSVPTNAVAPSITGIQTQGQMVTAVPGSWVGMPTGSYAYQWKRAGTNIGGATASTYVLTGTDVGQAITVQVIATNVVGPSSPATSSSITPNATLTISGTPGAAVVGTPYSFTPSSAGGHTPKTYALTGTLPSGLTFAPSTGAITGTPTSSGTASGLNITVTDIDGLTASLGTFSLVVSSSTPATYLPATTATRAATWGVTKLISAYSGPLMRLRRPSDNAELDWSPAGTGATPSAPDYSAIDSWSPGADPYVTTLYDQTGAGNHATQTTATLQMMLSSRPEDVSGGIRGASTIWGATGTRRSINTPALGFSSQNHGYTYAVHQRIGNDGAMLVESLTSGAGIVSNNFTLSGMASQNANQGSGLYPRSEPLAITFSSSAGGRAWRVNGQTATGSVMSAATANGAGYIARSTAGSGFDGQMTLFAFSVFTTAPTTGDTLADQDALNTIFAMRTSGWTKRLLYSGSSLITSVGKTLNRTLLVWQQFDSTWECYNIGRGGQSMATQYSGRASIYGQINTAMTRNIIVLDAPSNDIEVQTFASQAAAEAWADTFYSGTTAPFISDAKAQHTSVRVVVPTCISRNGFTTGNFKEYARLRYNSNVRTGAAGAGATLSDRCTYAPFDTTPTLTNFISDGIHPNDTGNQQLAAIDKTAILAAGA